MSVELNEPAYASAIRAKMRTRWLGQPLYYYSSVTSTNDLLAEMASEGAPAGTLIVTDHQTHGKGRLSRRWQAPSGTSLLFSLLLRPAWPAEQAAWVTMIAGLAAIEAIEATTGLTAGLKWPNDLMLPVDDEWRKVGGLLLEGEFVDGQLQTAVLGAGINANMFPDQLPPATTPATSLLIASGQVVERHELLAQLLLYLENVYEAATEGRSPRADWEARLLTLGQFVQVSRTNSQRTLDGIAEGIDEWGRLLVRDDSGRLHVISAGDVTLRVDNSQE